MIYQSAFTLLGALSRLKEAIGDNMDTTLVVTHGWDKLIASAPKDKRTLVGQAVLCLLEYRLMGLATQLNIDEDVNDDILKAPESIQALHSELTDVEARLIGIRSKVNKTKLQYLAQGYENDGLSYLTNWGK